MKYYLYSILLLFIAAISSAQVPEPHMFSLDIIGGGGSDNFLPNNIRTTDDGGFILHIQSSSWANSGNIDSFCSGPTKRELFIKYNENASHVEWSKCYGFNGDSAFHYYFPTSDGGNVLGGLFLSSASWGFLIAKYHADGSVLWRRNYSKGKGSILKAMMATEDGGYIMMGESHQTDTNVYIHYGSWSTFDIWVIKLDSNGHKVWSKVIGGSYDEGAIALVPAPGNGCYVVGTTQSSDYDCTGYHAGGQDAYVARLDKDGNILWHRCLGGSGYEAGNISGNAIPNGKGGLIMTVSTTSADGDVSHHIDETDYWALSLDSVGNVIWDNCYDNSAFEFPTSICKATDGSIWINGWTNGAYDDVLLVHADSVGNVLHQKVMSSYKGDRGKIVHPLPGGLVLVGGSFYANNSSFSSLPYYGVLDVFLSVFAPWAASVPDIQTRPNQLKIYPNPANKTLYIEAEESRTEYVVSLISIDGKLVYTTNLKAGNNKIEIDVSSFSKGLYYVQVTDADGRSTKKLMIQ